MSEREARCGDGGGVPRRVLFIGNSHTYANAMPFQFRAMVRARFGGAACEVWSFTVGGKSLAWHAREPGTIQTIRMHDWDAVVLQQQSHPFPGYEELAAACQVLDARLKKTGAAVHLYATWKQKNAPEDVQAEMDAAFARVAVERGWGLVPVGAVWAACRRAYPDLELYAPDEGHASPAGSYLAACCFFAAFANASPAGLPCRLEHNGETLVDLGEREAERIQHVTADRLYMA